MKHKMGGGGRGWRGRVTGDESSPLDFFLATGRLLPACYTAALSVFGRLTTLHLTAGYRAVTHGGEAVNGKDVGILPLRVRPLF